ncbi:RDD family protein [Salinithrix halophila]|uniref:RDD family protein n=1 Tax=Salinithrix halophila TaxID=1485204 RepID=A0ABV8JG92_9BACL
MENRVAVTTPEYVHLEFETAGIGSRAVSILIDWLIMGVTLLLLIVPAIFFTGFSELAGSPFWTSVVQGVFIVFLVFFPLCYYTLTETFLSGQTLGKKVTGLRVVTDRGTAPGFSAVFLRNLLRVADSLPFLYLIGISMVFFHPREKRVGDWVAGTIVVRKEGRLLPEGGLIQPVEESGGLLEVDLPSREFASVTEEEKMLLASFLSRRHELFPEEREDLARRLITTLLPETTVDPGQEETFLEAAYIQMSQKSAI